MATVMIGPVLIAGSISRLINIIGVREPTRAATDTARMIPVPTTTPNMGSVFNTTSAVRPIKNPQRTPKITPLRTPTRISFLIIYAIFHLECLLWQDL